MRSIYKTLLAIPMTLAVMAMATASFAHADSTDYDIESNISELERTVAQFERVSMNGSPVAAKLKDRAMTIADQLKRALEKQHKEILTAKIEESVRNMQFAKNFDQAHRVEILSGRLGQPMNFVRRMDPNKPWTVENTIYTSMTAEAQTAEELAKGPQNTAEVRTWVQTATGTGKYFGAQMMYFQLAQGITVVAQLAMNYKNNPLALEEFWRSMTSPDGVVSLGAFIAVNHWSSRLLSSVHDGTLPPMVIGYASMGAATLGSGLFMDLYTDKDFWACAGSYSDGKPGIDEKSCDASMKKWVLSNKIMQYGPQLMGLTATMIASGVTSGALRAALKQGANGTSKLGAGVVTWADKQIARLGGNAVVKISEAGASLGGKKVSFILRGIKFVRNVGMAASAASEITPWGGAVVVGEMAIFFLWDAVIQEPMNAMLSEYQQSIWDLDAFLESQMRMHYSFDHRQDFTQQPIANAFDVMATNMESSTRYMETLMGLFRNDYDKLIKPLENCRPASTKLTLDPIYSTDYLTEHWGGAFLAAAPQFFGPIGDEARMRGDNLLVEVWKMFKRWEVNDKLVKSNTQLECEVMAQPRELIARYHETQKKWRDLRLSSFTRSMDSWAHMVSGFNDHYHMAYRTGRYLSQYKWNAKKMPSQAGKPIITHDLLIRGLGMTTPPEPGTEGLAAGAEGEGQEKTPTHPENYDRVQTDDLMDYVIAGFACGPTPHKAEGFEAFWQGIVNAVGGATQGSGFVSTTIGTSSQFVTPNLTNRPDNMCMALAHGIGEVNKATGDFLFSPRTDYWNDADGVRSTSLYQWVYDNLDPKIWDGASGSSFDQWWRDNIYIHINDVWGHYNKAYNELVDQNLRPVLFDRSYRWGCNAGESPGPMDEGYHPDQWPNEEGFTNESEDRNPIHVRREYLVQDKYGKRIDAYSARVSGNAGSSVIGEKLCFSKASGYKVGNGALLSIELEMRMYMRVLKYMMAPVPEKPVAGYDQDQYLTLANVVLDQLKRLSRQVDGLKKEEFDTSLDELTTSYNAFADYVIGILKIDEESLKAQEEAHERNSIWEIPYPAGLYLAPGVWAVLNPDAKIDYMYRSRLAPPKTEEPSVRDQIRQVLAGDILSMMSKTLSEASAYGAWAALMDFSGDGVNSGHVTPKSGPKSSQIGILRNK